MRLCLFLSFRARDAVSLDDELAQLTGVLQTIRGLRKALLHTASHADDPYLDDGAPPHLVLQLYFDELPDLETALAQGGPLKVLLSRDAFPLLAEAEVTQQVMLVRPFAVGPLPTKIAHGEPYCTYLVSYEGEAEDLNAWLSHYLSEHTRYMAEFPDIRELEVYTRLDWVSALPWRRVHHMQRNKVAFDSADALTRALNSPVRHRMREDYKTFPAFTGANTHYAMVTRVVEPQPRGGASSPRL
jgi:hypothetical protein